MTKFRAVVTAIDNNAPEPTKLYFGGRVGAMFVTVVEFAHVFTNEDLALSTVGNISNALWNSKGARNVDIKLERIQ